MNSRHLFKIISAVCLVAICAAVGIGCGENTQQSPLSSASDSFETSHDNAPDYQGATSPEQDAVVTAASAGNCGVVRVDVRNSSGYDGVLVELIGQGVRKRLSKDEWLIDFAVTNSNVTIRATFQSYSTTQTFAANSRCNVRTKVVRLSPGIIRLYPIESES